MTTRRVIGVAGLGTVGSVIARRAQRLGYDVIHHDPASSLSRSLHDIASAAAVFIAVPTPLGTDGRLDTTIVRSVCRQLQSARLAIIVSTLYPGTCAAIRKELPHFRFAYVPEFLRAAHALTDFTSPARVVVASDEQDVCDDVAELYRALAPGRPIVFPSTEVAEILKLSSNAFLAAKIIFASELREASGEAWEEVWPLLSMDPRIGPSHLEVDGSGFGGACLPKDAVALTTWMRRHGARAQLMRAVLMANGRFLRSDRAESRRDRPARKQQADSAKVNSYSE